MCGIAGYAGSGPAAGPLLEALLALQHRGQDAAGIVTSQHDGHLCLHKDNGMVTDVFTKGAVANLHGNVGIGHVRYPTAGSSSCAEAQPFYVNSPYGIALAHNGNLVNTKQLQEQMAQELRHINTGSDSEAMLNLFASALFDSRTAAIKASGGSHLPTQPLEPELVEAVRAVMARCIGGYAVVSTVGGYGLVCWRDPNGIRPLSYGRRKMDAGDGFEYMVVSESGTLTGLGFELVGDVPPGFALLLPRDGSPPRMHNCLASNIAKPLHAPCVFEYVYFARPDSVLDGVSVYRARLRMGEKLAHNILRSWPEHDIDVVIPIPDTSRTSALECAATLGIKYREGFIKNRYVGRTFIMPDQGLRKKTVRQKLSPIGSELINRNVLLVDDSIVRGTTSSQIITMAREAGAKRVYIASAAPPVLFPNVYGIDMPTKSELLAPRHDHGEGPSMAAMAKEIGADRCIFQELPDLVAAIVECAEEQGSDLKSLDCSCFDGKYVTSEDGKYDEYLEGLAVMRSDSRNSGNESNPLHYVDRLESKGSPDERKAGGTSPPKPATSN